MVGGISKRQQQRNERALQDLIRSVPGNDRCADCSAMNPGWASWNLGVFLCMRCAALHRKMGTHISKVKSLSMDSWSAEHVDNMKSYGNTIVNKIYNPRNVQPPVPTDIDEADACMERFIRQKYQTRTLEDGKPKPPSRKDPSYTRSAEGSPPPLPPKPPRPFGFGLRSASSATNLNHHTTSTRGPESLVSDSRRSSFESKLVQLREMGFTNERRNATALRNLDGNLEKTIEALVRVGEGNPSSRVRTPAATTPGTSGTGNPFDQLDSKPPTQSQPNGQAYNPFDMSTAQSQPQPQAVSTQPFEQYFQNLQVAQPLFPHSTGGYPVRQNSVPQPTYNQFAASPFTPSQAGFVSSAQPFEGGINPFLPTGAQPQASLSTPPLQNSLFTQTNPFFNQMPTQALQLPLHSQSAAVTSASGAAFPPSLHANTMPPKPPMSTPPFGQPSHFQQQQQPQLGLQTTQPGQGSFNPFQSMTAPNTPLGGGYPPSQFGYPSGTQPFVSQPTGRVDKNSILALYNFSAPPPSIPEQQQVLPRTQNSQSSEFAPSDYHNTQSQPSLNAQPAGSRNPFFGGPATSSIQQPPTQVPTRQSAYGMAMHSAGPAANTGFMRSHMSQHSVDINGFQNGRHSPDAFASLSSRLGQ